MTDPDQPGNVTTHDDGGMRNYSEQYEPLPIRFSYLKALGRSPAHCKLAMDTDRFKMDEEPNVSLERGTALHHLVFGTRRVIGYTEGKVRRGKEWEAFLDQNRGALVLTAGEYETVARMAQAVADSPVAGPLILLDSPIYEQTIYWNHVGRRCRGTVDISKRDFIADLKSCEKAEPNMFQWASRKYSYHAQMAWYMDGINAHRTEMKKAFSERCERDLWAIRAAYIVAVESKPPYPVTVMRLTERALELGRKQYSLWLERFLACEQSGEWPGYVQSVVDLDVPEDETELIFEDSD